MASGNRLHEVRKRRGLTLEDLAKKIGKPNPCQGTPPSPASKNPL